MSTFKIDPAFEKTSSYLADLAFSQVRLEKDGQLDWFILIPRKSHLIDWSDLSQSEQSQLCHEITLLSQLLKTHSRPDKINVANLGNKVSQFHVHVIGRLRTDRAWPGAIWGTTTPESFDEGRVAFWREQLERAK